MATSVVADELRHPLPIIGARLPRRHVRLGAAVFKRKKLDRLVAQRLDARGVPSKFWLRFTLEAIQHCESGNPTEVAFSSAGPVPARTVIVLLDLETFVERPIDWHEPILDGSLRGRWFLQPDDDLSFDGASEDVLVKLAHHFYPSEHDPDIRWVDSRLVS